MGKQKQVLTLSDFNEMRNYKRSFDKAMKEYHQAWKRISELRFNPIERDWGEIRNKTVIVNHQDYIGFSKKELEFINFIVMEKLRDCDKEEKDILLSLNKQIVQKIHSKPLCVNCGNSDVTLNGSRINRYGRTQKFKCNNCNVMFSFGKQNADVRSLVRILKLHFYGLSSRDIHKKIIDEGKEYIHFSNIARLISELKPFLRPRLVELTDFKRWIKVCPKCKKDYKKIRLGFSYCQNDSPDLHEKAMKLHKEIMESNLYEVPEN